MPKASMMPTTSRRQTLQFSSMAATVSLLTPALAVAATPGPDADLLGLCRQLEDDTHALRSYEALTLALWKPTDQAEVEVLLGHWHGTIDQIIPLPARTAAGIRTKAAALGHALMQKVAVSTGLSFDQQAEDYELLAMSLVRDLVGEVPA
jgi:hypothetical protein